jgi:hypothetical protein
MMKGLMHGLGHTGSRGRTYAWIKDLGRQEQEGGTYAWTKDTGRQELEGGTYAQIQLYKARKVELQHRLR